MSAPILELAGVTIGTASVYDSSVSEVSLVVEPGDLALVLLERERIHLPLADLAVGILTPDEGHVRLRGADWQAMPPYEAADRRAGIGRVFEGNPWIEGMEVSQSIMLAELHHTQRPVAEVTSQAAALSRDFGLPGLPLSLPATVQGKDLARAACARAFMGEPDLLILERPTTGIYPELLPALLNMLRAARDRGAAVLWLTDNSEIWDAPEVRPTLRGQMYGARMRVESKDGPR